MKEPVLIYTCCDRTYADLYLPSLVRSCSDYGIKIAIDVVTTIGKNQLNTYRSEKQSSVISKIKTQYTDIAIINDLTIFEHSLDLSKNDLRSYYASARFFMMNHNIERLKHRADGILIIDTDSILNRKLDISSMFNYPIALYQRDPLPGTVGIEKDGTRIAAGAVYLNLTDTPIRNHNIKITMFDISSSFIATVSKSLYKKLERPFWFMDQLSLYEAKKKLPPEFVGNIDSSIIDWDFTIGSMIWTGKGDRKYNNKTYLERFEALRERF